eukprot:gb/GECH01008554.1/.p1 GENE.gb/GECH01008554.1/~~gb/GECH01008554.1/.p1  ORF type:complete len:257 (+),score=51.07 gb/GECH01008554.1/:1-771(+)
MFNFDYFKSNTTINNNTFSMLNLSEIDWNKYHLKNAPRTIYYIPEFITQEEETNLLQNIGDTNDSIWKQLSNRKVQNHGGVPHPKGMFPKPIPEWLCHIIRTLSSSNLFSKEPNHVLINEYYPNQGIMYHEDGPIYEPMVCILSLESGISLQFKPHRRHIEPQNSNPPSSSTSAQEIPRQNFSIYLKPRSLLVFSHDVYTEYLHGIEEKEIDQIDEQCMNLKLAQLKPGTNIKRNRRVSLTVRVVKKVINKKLFNI